MVHESAQTIALKGEIVTALCSHNVNQPVLILATNTLLEQLQLLFPASAWTDESLAAMLPGMIKQGLIKKQGGCCETVAYTLATFASARNYAKNNKYVAICSQLSVSPCPCGRTGLVSALL